MKRLKVAMGPAGFLVAMFALMIAVSSGSAYAAVMIGTSNIKNGAVTAPKLATNSVTGAKVAANSVTGAKVANGTLTLADFTAADRAKILGPKAADAVRVELLDQVVAAEDFGTFVVYCPGTRKVTGGGYFSSIAVASSSAPNADRSGWLVQINNFDNAISVEIDAYAICS